MGMLFCLFHIRVIILHNGIYKAAFPTECCACSFVFEFMGGIFTGSVSILSDALHDMGDAISIGISYFLEGKSKRQPDEKHTYGYARYSVIGGALSSLILIPGSVMIIYNGG